MNPLSDMLVLFHSFPFYRLSWGHGTPSEDVPSPLQCTAAAHSAQLGHVRRVWIVTSAGAGTGCRRVPFAATRSQQVVRAPGASPLRETAAGAAPAGQ